MTQLYQNLWGVFDTDFNAIVHALLNSIGNGVLSGFDATVTGTDLIVTVAAGNARANNTYRTFASSTNINFTGDPDATNPKKALIVVDSTGAIIKRVGTAEPASPSGDVRRNTLTPTPPALQATDLVLFEVWLTAGATAIVAADVSDRRFATKANLEVVEHVLPRLTENFDLGSAALRWRDLHIGRQIIAPLAGSTGGLVIGGNANLYRSAANVLKTDNQFHGNVLASTNTIALIRDVDNNQARITGGSKFSFVANGIGGSGVVFHGIDEGGAGLGGNIEIYALTGRDITLRHITSSGGSTIRWTMDSSGNLVPTGALTVDGVDVSELRTKSISFAQPDFEVGLGSPSVDTLNITRLWKFDDGLSETVRSGFRLPDDWKSGTGIVVKFLWTRSFIGTGNVVWRIKAIAYGSDELLNTGGTSFTNSVTVAIPVLAALAITNMGTIPAANLAVGDWISIEPGRGGDAGDTYTQDAELVGVVFEYTAG